MVRHNLHQELESRTRFPTSPDAVQRRHVLSEATTCWRRGVRLERVKRNNARLRSTLMLIYYYNCHLPEGKLCIEH